MFNRKGKIITALALAAVIIAGVFIYNSTGKDIKLLGESSFPQALQGLPLSQIVSGPQAVAMISKLHGSDISVRQGYIASYIGSQGQIMIWVSESDNEKGAVELFEIMDERIAAPGQTGLGQPPFTDRRPLNLNGKKVIAVKGMGMENYYYQIGNKVYWVAAGGVDPMKALEAVMKIL